MSDERQVIAETAHLRLVQRDGWTYVQRSTASGVVCVIARTADDRLLLVEQFRVPVDGPVIELPAGLCGDQSGQAHESFEVAARRELLEETGYQADRLRLIATLVSSGGISDEVVTFFVADGIQRIAQGGGDESELITVHEVPLAEIDRWLEQAGDAGKAIDARVYSGLYFLRRDQNDGRPS